MFFIMGIYDRIKELNYHGDMEVCPRCGRYCSYKVFMTYMCLSLFFIPVLKWGRKYYVETSCCKGMTQLKDETGKRLQRGEKVNVTKADMN